MKTNMWIILLVVVFLVGIFLGPYIQRGLMMSDETIGRTTASAITHTFTETGCWQECQGAGYNGYYFTATGWFSGDCQCYNAR